MIKKPRFPLFRNYSIQLVYNIFHLIRVNYIYKIHKYIINSYFDSAHLQSYFKKNSNWNLQIRFPSIKCIKKPQNLEQRNFCQNPIIFFPSWMKDTIKGIYFCMPIVFSSPAAPFIDLSFSPWFQKSLPNYLWWK